MSSLTLHQFLQSHFVDRKHVFQCQGQALFVIDVKAGVVMGRGGDGTGRIGHAEFGDASRFFLGIIGEVFGTEDGRVVEDRKPHGCSGFAEYVITCGIDRIGGIAINQMYVTLALMSGTDGFGQSFDFFHDVVAQIRIEDADIAAHADPFRDDIGYAVYTALEVAHRNGAIFQGIAFQGRNQIDGADQFGCGDDRIVGFVRESAVAAFAGDLEVIGSDSGFADAGGDIDSA